MKTSKNTEYQQKFREELDKKGLCLIGGLKIPNDAKAKERIRKFAAKLRKEYGCEN